MVLGESMNKKSILGMALPLLAACQVQAGEVQILDVEFINRGKTWDVRTKVRHDDSGWEHFADAWRVVTENGAVLGTRILQHPHVDEQPFVRSLHELSIPPGVTTVYVEARDNVNGWSSQRVKVDLKRRRGPHFRVR